MLSLVQRSFPGPARARPMRLYAAVLAGGAWPARWSAGCWSARIWDSTWRPVFLLNVPIGAVLLIAGGPGSCRGGGRAGPWPDRPGSPSDPRPAGPGAPAGARADPGTGRPGAGRASAASGLGFAAFALVERRLAAAGGPPLIPGRVLRLPGVAIGIGALFAVLAVFGGFFFTLALHLQGGAGSVGAARRAHLRPAGLAVALVSLDWQRISRSRWR